MDNIIKSIDVYMQELKSDYAIMLDGSWGVGKTYFVKNKLIKYLQNNYNKNVIYISLFGISNMEELFYNISCHIFNLYINKKSMARAQIFYGIKVPKLNTAESTSVSSLVNIVSKGLKILPKGKSVDCFIGEINKNIIQFSDYIFIFDDFERSSIKSEDILGVFNKIVEQGNSKTIIICNESKIQDCDFYKIVKEKVVGLTIRYRSDFYNIFDIIAKEYIINDHCRKIFIKNKEKIINVFNIANTQNLRILISICKRFSEVYLKIDNVYFHYDLEKQYYNNFIDSILLNIVFSELYWRIKGKKSQYDAENDVKGNIINAKMFDDKDDRTVRTIITSYKIIDEYLYTYFWNEVEFDKILIAYIQQSQSNLSLVVNRVNRIFLMNDNDALIELKKFIDDIEKNKFNVNVYPKILDELWILIELLNDGNIDIEKLKSIIVNNAINKVAEFNSMSWSVFPYENTGAKVFIDDLYNQLKAKSASLQSNELGDIFNSSEGFEENFEKYVLNYKNNFPLNHRIFLNISIDTAVRRILELNAREIAEFNSSISYIFDVNIINLKDFYSGDKEFLENLHNKIIKELDKKSKLEIYQLKLLCKNLKLICENL